MFLPELHTFFREKRYRNLTLTTLAVLVVGIIGYRLMEGWSWLDSIHYAVSIMVTTGNAEIYPITYWGKVFNVFYMILSVFLILFFISTLQQHFRESRHTHKSKQQRHRKIIDKKIKNQVHKDFPTK